MKGIIKTVIKIVLVLLILLLVFTGIGSLVRHDGIWNRSKVYTVKFYVADEQVAAIEVPKGTAIGDNNMPAAPKAPDGNVFAGWYAENGIESKEITADTVVNANLTVKAKFKEAGTMPPDPDNPDNPDPDNPDNPDPDNPDNPDPDNPDNPDNPDPDKPDPAHVCSSKCSICGKCTNASCTEAVCAEKCQGHEPVKPAHVCESKCSICGKCTNTSCTEAVCAEKCQGHEPVKPTHVCESKCGICGKCTNASCTEAVCTEKCQGHEPAHVCESKCGICGKCTNASCAEAVCAEKCQGHEPAHVCESKCSICGKCTNASCTEAVCAEKCPGHEPAHVCESKCSICGKCTNTSCTEAVCAEKCQGHEPAHVCESKCSICGKCTNASCTKAVCAEKCAGHEPAHVCESKCGICGKCTNTSCTEAVCAEKCQGHEPVKPTHVCESKCSICGKCTNTSCAEAVCANKCAGHDPDHVCESKCEVCGKCTNKDCGEKVCAEKCAGHETPDPDEPDETQSNAWSDGDDLFGEYYDWATPGDDKQTIVGATYRQGVFLGITDSDVYFDFGSSLVYGSLENKSGGSDPYVGNYDDENADIGQRYTASTNSGLVRFKFNVSGQLPYIQFRTIKYSTAEGVTVTNFRYTVSEDGGIIEGSFGVSWSNYNTEIGVVVSVMSDVECGDIVIGVDGYDYGAEAVGKVQILGVDSDTSRAYVYLEGACIAYGERYDIAYVSREDTEVTFEEGTHNPYCIVSLPFDGLAGFEVYVGLRLCEHGAENTVPVTVEGDIGGADVSQYFTYRFFATSDGIMRMEYWLSADAPFYVDDLTVAGYAADEEYPPRKQCGEGKTFGYVKFKASGGESITVLVKDVNREKSPTDYIKVYYDFGEEEVDVNDVSYSLVYSEDEDCVIVSYTGMSVAEVTSESGEVQWVDQGDGTVLIWNPDQVEVTVRFIP